MNVVSLSKYFNQFHVFSILTETSCTTAVTFAVLQHNRKTSADFFFFLFFILFPSLQPHRLFVLALALNDLSIQSFVLPY